MLILQFLFYALLANIIYTFSYALYLVALALSIWLALYILGLKNGPVDVKLPWVVLILLFPVFGSIFYLLFRNQKVRKKIRLNIESQAYATSKVIHDATDTYDTLKELDRSIYNQSKYIFKTTNMPIYQNTESKYFEIGEEYYKDLIEELKKAEKFIFIEYFIIKMGTMWNTIFNILKEKAASGVEVRILYDDFGCITSLPTNYKQHIEKYGIKCEVFNTIYPIVTLAHNNRDHRKIVVIDGKVGFTGGINLADEYINKQSRFGHWKDTGVMIKGDAVKSFTLMFLEAWHIYRDKNEDYTQFVVEPQTNNSKEFIQPYLSTPMDDEEIVARNVYVNILNSATDYVYITTPYLILDPELKAALINAGKRDVDVRIITPGIPDKKYVFTVTRSEYADLLKNNIRIFEYTPGFIHAKNVVADDKVATCGSINFDNRSFYHSYECGLFMYNSHCVNEIKEDFIKTQEISKEIPKDYTKTLSTWCKIKSAILRVLIPLL